MTTPPPEPDETGLPPLTDHQAAELAADWGLDEATTRYLQHGPDHDEQDDDARKDQP